MKSTLLKLSIIGLMLFSPSAAQERIVDELDAYWAEMARAVEQGDFEGYSRLYHPDAVLVELASGTSHPIAQGLARWKQGFLDTRDGKARASVTFRFTQRMHDETTAHETGIFRYTFKPEGGKATVYTAHLEALLVRRNGAWLMLMEYQKQPATDEEWEAKG